MGLTRRLIMLTVFVAAAVAVFTVWRLLSSREARASNCVPSWKSAAKLNGGQAVAALSPNDVWVVGPGTRVKHFDGRRWTVASGRGSGELFDIAGTAADDVWAVGTTTTAVAKNSLPLIEHWDGQRWTIVSAPRVAGTQLYGIVVIGVRDAWAVGGTYEPDEPSWRTFVAHWDGRSWRQIPSPVRGSPLEALVAFSAHDIWAAGWSVGEGSHEGIQHWDGRRWTPAVSRPFRGGDSRWYPGLSDISGSSSANLWVVGHAAAGPIVEHRIGSKWLEVRIPFAHFRENYDAGVDSSLSGVAALEPSNVWAVGNFGIEHWTGKQWQRLRPFRDEAFSDIAALSPTDMWAVSNDMILHYSCGSNP